MQDKIDEIMGLVDEVEYLSYKTRPVDHLRLPIQSKLREMVESCSVKVPLSDDIIDNQYSEDYSFDGECAAFRAGARFAERTHNIINTTKE